MRELDTKFRSVLAAPRGHRFSRPGRSRPTPAASRSVTRPTVPESWKARQGRLLRQMVGNPRVAHRLEYGELPHWMTVARQRREQAEREAKAAESKSMARAPVAPVAPRGRHRAPRRRPAWLAAAVSAALLFRQAFEGAVDQEVALAAGSLI